MHHTATIAPAFAQLLRIQQGTFVLSQAEGLALDEKTVNRLTQRGIWFRHARGLYAITPTLTWHQQAWCGVLLGGSSAVISGLAAAHLDGYANQPDEICVYSSRRVGVLFPGLVFRRGTRRGHGELPRARTESAIIDAAAILRPAQ
ncbi:MAG: type IV toxin-antitoxin system AbiEi family antitoxin domain-containing protein [Propionibacteriaceae bacterium]